MSSTSFLPIVFLETISQKDPIFLWFYHPLTQLLLPKVPQVPLPFDLASTFELSPQGFCPHSLLLLRFTPWEGRLTQ